MDEDINFCECCGRPIQEVINECKTKGTFNQYCNSMVYKHHEYYIDDDEIFTDGDIEYCAHCGNKLTPDDIIIGYEHHEFWGAPCTEKIMNGYYCHKCKYEVNY